jgi:hypothetical protein
MRLASRGFKDKKGIARIGRPSDKPVRTIGFRAHFRCLVGCAMIEEVWRSALELKWWPLDIAIAWVLTGTVTLTLQSEFAAIQA